jgi:hypothetical protein
MHACGPLIPLSPTLLALLFNFQSWCRRACNLVSHHTLFPVDTLHDTHNLVSHCLVRHSALTTTSLRLFTRIQNTARQEPHGAHTSFAGRLPRRRVGWIERAQQFIDVYAPRKQQQQRCGHAGSKLLLRSRLARCWWCGGGYPW